MDESLKHFLLMKLTPKEFSSLIYRILLQNGYFEMNPVDGTNDHGVDIELYTFSFTGNVWVVQISVQEDYKSKIQHTIAKFKKFNINPFGIVYITNQSIPNAKRNKLEIDTFSQGYLLHIFDERWVLPRVELHNTRDTLIATNSFINDLFLPTIEAVQPLPYFLKDVLNHIHSSIDVNSPMLPLISQVLSSCMLSYHLRQHGYLNKALFHSQKAYSLSTKCNNSLLFFLCSHLHGEILKNIGRYDEAKPLFNYCLEYSRNLKEKYWESIILTNLAEIKKKPLKAILLCTEAIAIKNKYSDIREIGISFGQHSKLSLRLGDVETALYFANQSLNYMEAISPSLIKLRGIATARLHLANIYLFKKDYDFSNSLSCEAEQLFNEINDSKHLVLARLAKVENIMYSHANKDELIPLLCKIFGNCIEMADSTGLKRLMRIISICGYS